MKKLFLLIAGIVVIVAVVMIAGKTKPEVVAENLVVKGAYIAPKALQLKNSASLTVEGPLTVSGKISCDGGPLNIIVEGDATVDGTLECNVSESTSEAIVASGISMVVKGSLTFGEDAKIISNGNVQIVSDASKLRTTEDQIEALYKEAGENSGAGPRIGPFIEGAPVSVKSSPVVFIEKGIPANAKNVFAKTAYAQTDKDGNAIPNVVIRGNWVIGEGGVPPSGVDVPTPNDKVKKIILNFDFGDDGNVELQDFHLIGPAGRDGKSDMGTSCNVRGEKGEDAFRMRVQAQDISIDNFRLELGNGGVGGEAGTKTDCEPGIATGGNGGEAGNFKMTAVGKIEIASMRIVPGVGGAGGNATANGKNAEAGCPGKNGGDATATGGDGGKNKKELAAQGAVTGIGNITIDEVRGGQGGLATANPGKGGDGNACGCNGGNGGKGTATGGKGGDASAKITGGTAVSTGGDGGDAESKGAIGGNGGSCGPDKKGGNGGKGGDAKSKAGKAGTGASAPGADGTIQDETGGNGGNGGDGCKEGKGGAGGSGNPAGEKGKDGKNLCVPVGETKTTIQVTPPPPATSDSKKIKAINYNGKYLPVDQLIIEDEIGCGADHWHAAQGVVKATDGSMVSDPGPQCGYGKTKDKPVMDVTLPQ